MNTKRFIYSVGHSNRTLGELVSILRYHGIRLLVDVRRFPVSRRYPWFNREVLETRLPERGIRYVWLGNLLGGLNRDFKTYMCSEEYLIGLERLEELASNTPTAFMCAERHWKRCHRRFIAESLYRRGWRVLHIIDLDRIEEHRGLNEELLCPTETTTPHATRHRTINQAKTRYA